MATVVEGDPKAPFSIATTPRCRGGCYSFPWIAPLYLVPYFIMLSVKQGSIKYPFLSLWCDSTWDWTQVSRAIDEHSNHHANVRYKSWKDQPKFNIFSCMILTECSLALSQKSTMFFQLMSTRHFLKRFSCTHFCSWEYKSALSV